MRTYSDWSLLLLRFISGIGFIVHGWAKLSRGTAGFEKLLTQLGVPFPHPMSVVVPYLELLGGIAVVAGILIKIISLSLSAVMLAALFTIHIHYGFSSIKTIGLNTNGPVFGPPGYEINLLYIAILISFIVNGAGKISVDNLIKKLRRQSQELSAKPGKTAERLF